MKKLFFLAISLSISIICYSQSTVQYLIKTSLGNIIVELYPQQAPVTVHNFMKYVESNLYDSSSFFRVCTRENEKDRKIKIEVIQGGNVPEEKQFDSIPLETTQQTKIYHKNGTISMARDKPHSATSSFFICINDQPELDFGGKRNPDGQGFAAFGMVTKGMEVVKKIQSQNNDNQYLIKPVIIYTIKKNN